MFESENPSVVERLKAASYALPVTECMQDIADDVASWDVDGVSRKEIDARIVRWMNDEGFGLESWLEEPEIVELTERFPQIDARKLWKAYGFEQWVKECVRSVAFTHEPIPFYPLAMGTMYDDRSDPEFPVVIAIMTPLTDVELAVSQIRNKLKKEFGKRAGRPTKKDEVLSARLLAMKRQGMPLREITIQMLREEHPDIVRHPHKYKSLIDSKKSTCAKRITAAEQVWKERGLDSSTAE